MLAPRWIFELYIIYCYAGKVFMFISDFDLGMAIEVSNIAF